MTPTVLATPVWKETDVFLPHATTLTGMRLEEIGSGKLGSGVLAGFAPPDLRSIPGNLPAPAGRQGFRSGGATGLAAHPGDSGELVRGKVLGPCPSTLGTAEFAEGNGVGVFLAWHGEATIVRYRTWVILT